MTDTRAERARKTADFVERILVASVVALITYYICVRFLDADPHGAGEPAVLNAGLAYYTHQATGGLAAMMSSVAGFATYHLIRRWQRDHLHREEKVAADKSPDPPVEQMRRTRARRN